jgi:uncharacterized membrane protein YeiH
LRPVLPLPRIDKLFFIIDFLGVFVGAIGGALATIRDTKYRYDIIGVLGLGFASALGGGIVRDIILQKGPPLAFIDIRYIVVAIAGATIALLFENRFGGRVERSLVWVDAAALGLFAVSGTTRALNAGFSQLPALLLGIVTAVGGGSMRDVLSGRPPKIFERGQLYAIAALLGSVMFLLALALHCNRTWASVIGLLSCGGLRMLSLRFNWRTRSVRSQDAPP